MNVLKKCILLITVIVISSIVVGATKSYQALHELYDNCRDI